MNNDFTFEAIADFIETLLFSIFAHISFLQEGFFIVSEVL